VHTSMALLIDTPGYGRSPEEVLVVMESLQGREYIMPRNRQPYSFQ
jgi:hypothetical protein